MTVAEAVLTLLGFPVLLVGAYCLDRGMCRKRKIAPDLHPVPPVASAASTTRPESGGSSAAGAREKSPSTSFSGQATEGGSVHGEGRRGHGAQGTLPHGGQSPGASFSGHGMGMLKTRVLAIKEALNSSFRNSQSADAGNNAQKKPSVTMVVGRWGNAAGAISDEQLREMQLAHIRKHYRNRVDHKRQLLRRVTGAAVPSNAPMDAAPRRSVLAHARSEAEDLGGARVGMRMATSRETDDASRDADDGQGSWVSNLRAAFLVNGGDRQAAPTVSEYACHALALPWKVLVALLPPADLLGGYPLFGSAIALIGLVTFLIDDVASQFGCCCGIPNSISAISFVALGTSLPDTLASRTAALQDDYADDSVGNITGSNSVNVFLGIGLPWLIGAVYWTGQGLPGMPVSPCSLGFSVVIFVVVAVLCIAMLCARRALYGYELGGKMKVPCALALVGLWFVYLVLSSLQAVGRISVTLTSEAWQCS